MLKNLATVLRASALYAHAAHNTISGETFLSDHEFLGDLYTALTTAYDDVVERAIGLGEEVDLLSLQVDAAESLKNLSLQDATAIFKQVLENEKTIQDEISDAINGTTVGTNDLLAGIADAGEVRIYKIRQRLGE